MSVSSPRRSSFVTERPVAVLMIFLAAMVFGALSYRRLPLTLMPELSYPTLTVRTAYPGAAPEEVENDISRRVEDALGVVSGLRRMSSTSRAGMSDVVLEFAWDVDMADAVQDTLEKLDLVFLPAEAERPLILRFDPTLDPVMELSLSGEGERFEGDEGLRRLRRIAELQVQRALEPIKGVAAVRVRGGLEEEIHVLLDAEQLQRTRLSVGEVLERLQQENINVAGGTLKEGRTEYLIRTVNEYANLEQIRDTVVTNADGREVRLRDLGTVARAHRERELLTRADGRESVQLELFKEADANMVELAGRIRGRLGELDLEAERARLRGEQPQLAREPSFLSWGRPGAGDESVGLAAELYRSEGALLRLVADRSVFIQDSVREVQGTAILGGLLAVVVLYLFLRSLVSTLFVAAAIPISLLMTFAPLNIVGVSLNIMSLGGLALGVGMLLDSSIVVLESIFRCREEGDDLVSAAVRGTLEVRSAVVASILTSIAVFFPMVFVEGIAGEAFGDLGLAVVVSLLASMAAALLFIPMLASRSGISWPRSSGERSRGGRFESVRLFARHFARLRSWWEKRPLLRSAGFGFGVLGLLLRLVVGAVFEAAGKLLLKAVSLLVFAIRRFLVPHVVRLGGFVVGAPLRLTESLLTLLGGSYPVLLRRALRWPLAVVSVMLLALAASGWFLTRLETELLPEVRQGEFTVEAALPVGTPLEETVRLLSPVEEAILAESSQIQSLLVSFGYDPSATQRSDEGEHTARFKVLLAPVSPEVEDRVAERLRRRFAELPDVSARLSRPVLFSFKTPIEVEVHGDDLRTLRRFGSRVEELLRPMPELADVETTLKSGAPEVQIVYDRALLSRYELDLQSVAEMVRNQVKGVEATLYNLKDRRIPIVVRLQEEDRRSTADLAGLVVNPEGERPIPLSAVAQVTLGEGPSEVRRVDGRRVALVRANLGVASLGRAVEVIRDRLTSEIDWPSDMAYVVAGQSYEWERSRSSLWLALGLSVFLVYVIMAAQFESLLQPLLIMFSIPLAFFGTVATLWLLEIPLSIVVLLGMIMLAGIVVNNAIVLVDYINTLRRRGLARDEAILTAAKVRLRPILMTTATTVLGLLPMAVGLGRGAEIRAPMAISVIGGLLSSTLLTLVVVPVLYALLDRARAALLGGEGVAREGDLSAAPISGAQVSSS